MEHRPNLELVENHPLAELTTLGIGGPARYLATARSETALLEALQFREERGLPLLVLGQGSNLLVADAGFPGLVVRIALRGIAWGKDGAVEAAAGESWDGLVAESVARHWAGIECLSGIPGTVGASPVQNIGAYGQEAAETLEQARAWDQVAAQWVELANPDCEFAYRASRFNRPGGERYIIVSVRYRLHPGGGAALRYAELARRFPAEAPSLAEVREAVREIRRGKAMLLDGTDSESRSAGSFFKNPLLTAEQLAAVERVAGAPPPRFEAGAGLVKVPAAWLIERAGFRRGQRLPGSAVGLSSRHVLAIVNAGGGTAAQVLELAGAIQRRAREHWGVDLVPEPRFVGINPGGG